MPRGASQTVVWDPADYAANSSAQSVWALEQIDRLDLRGNERILDVGCGDGKITAELALRVPRGCVVGGDRSSAMVDYARTAFPARSHRNLEFRVMDARHLRLDTSFDLVFSNATLHWVDDHLAFLRGAANCLGRGGRLVVSCGGKGNAQEVFSVVRGRMRVKRWRSYFRRMKAPYFFHRPEDYERWFKRCGFQALTARLVQKNTTFSGDSLAAWVRTTWLPYTQRVPEGDRSEFIADVASHYIAKHPADAGGQIHVQMVRLELGALKP